MRAFATKKENPFQRWRIWGKKKSVPMKDLSEVTRLQSPIITKTYSQCTT